MIDMQIDYGSATFSVGLLFQTVLEGAGPDDRSDQSPITVILFGPMETFCTPSLLLSPEP